MKFETNFDEFKKAVMFQFLIGKVQRNIKEAKLEVERVSIPYR